MRVPDGAGMLEGSLLLAGVAPEIAGRATLLMLTAVSVVTVLLVRERIGRVTGGLLVAGYAVAVAVMAG